LQCPFSLRPCTPSTGPSPWGALFGLFFVLPLQFGKLLWPPGQSPFFPLTPPAPPDRPPFFFYVFVFTNGSVCRGSPPEVCFFFFGGFLMPFSGKVGFSGFGCGSYFPPNGFGFLCFFCPCTVGCGPVFFFFFIFASVFGAGFTPPGCFFDFSTGCPPPLFAFYRWYFCDLPVCKVSPPPPIGPGTDFVPPECWFPGV